MTNGANVKKGHDYEREVKDMFIKHGWGCIRSARSKEVADTIAFVRSDIPHNGLFLMFACRGYDIAETPGSLFDWVAIKKDEHNIRKTYFTAIMDPNWEVVLMQQKIYKRWRKKR